MWNSIKDLAMSGDSVDEDIPFWHRYAGIRQSPSKTASADQMATNRDPD
jgi:hypothetical protein